MKRKDLARRAASAAMAACMMFTLSAPALAESTDALMQLSIGSYRSSSLLSEENSFPTITVDGKTVTEENKDTILGECKLIYDETTKTLKSSGMIKGNLTIDAPGVNIELYNPGSNPAVQRKLTVTNAASVKVTSKYYVAVGSDVEISCDGKVEITSGTYIAVLGNMTVNQASEVAISGKSNNLSTVTGNVKIACSAPVTIRNNGTRGVAKSIDYSGTSYKYYTEESGTAHDPAGDPIKNHLTSGYLRITPVTLHALTVKNGTTTVPGSTSTTNTKNQTTTSVNVAKDDVVEIEGKNFDSAKKAFDQWKVESGDAVISDPYSEKTTLTVKGEGKVTVKASYMTPRTVTVTDGNGTVKGLTQHGTEKIFAGDTVEVTAKEFPGKLFDHWECAPELTDESGNPLTENAKKNSTVTFKMPQGDVTLTAVYKEAKSFTLKHGTILSVTRGGKSVPVTDGMELFAGDTVEITPNNRLDEKLKFDRWNVKLGNVTLNGTKTATFTMPDEPVELEAVYNNLYTVTVNDGTATDTINHIAGDTVTVKANVPAGEKFTGWKVKNNTALSFKGQSIDLTKPVITFTMPRTNITLTAEHKTIHTLYVVGGTIDGSSKSIQAIEGERITVHSALAADQQFLHWTSEGMGLTETQSKSDPLTITMPDSDVKITAVPKQLYTVTVRNGTVRDQLEATVNPGDPVTIQADDRTALGEVFVGWTVTSLDANGQPNVKLDDPTAESTTFTMIGANVEVEAKYEKQHTVTVLYQTEETGTPTEDISQKKTAIFGEDIKVKAEDKTAEDLIFDHWEVTVGGKNVTDLFADYKSDDAHFTMQRDNVTLTAVYKKLYTITVTNNVNSDVYEAGKTKKDGTVSLEAAPIPGYRFKSWKVLRGDAVVSDTGILTLNDDGDVLVRAEYVKLYNLTVNHGTAVNANGDADSAAEGDRITATANDPTPDQIFTGWTVEGGDIGLNAEELKKSEINFTMPAGAVTLTPNYSYVHDQTVKVTYGKAYTADTTADAKIIATPGETVYIEPEDRMADNWFFTGWKVTGGKDVSLEYDENGTHFVMPQSDEIVKITAQYAKLNAVTINDGDVIDADGHGINNMNDGKPGAIAGTNITIKAKDKSAEGKVFDYWEVTGDKVHLTKVNDDGSVATFEMPTFEMPDEAVVITARYANVHDVTVHSDDLSYNKTFEDIKVGTTYKVTAPKIANKRFDHWHDNNGNLNDLDVKAGTFTMPNYDVDLTAVYVGLNDVTVKYGTAVNKTVETETTTDGDGRIVLPAADGDKVTVTADEPTMETFEGWTLTADETVYDENGSELTTDEEGYILKTDGERLTELSFTFVMPAGGVNLKANYSMPAYVVPQWVTVEGGTAFAEGEAAAAEIIVDPGKRITVIADPNADSNMIFDYWEVTSLDEDGKATATLEDATSMTTSFTMPMAPVELTAHWRTIDEAPSGDGDGAGVAIAGVAIGGAAVWGGYEIATRVILHNILPEGAEIPANRGQLALLVWNTAGRPEPVNTPAFADVADADTAKAAQWCVEQGIMEAKTAETFKPEGWTPKLKVIEVWNKAFPKQ